MPKFDWSKHTPIAKSETSQPENKKFDWSKHTPIGKEDDGFLSKTADIGKEALRQVGRTGRMVATGAASIGDIPNLGALALHSAGLKDTPEFYPSPSEAVREGIDHVTGGRLKPKNGVEDWVDFIGEGLAPLAMAPFTGGSSLTGLAAKQAAKNLAQKGSMGFAQKAAEKLAKFGGKTYAPTASNISGNALSSVGIKTYLENNDDPGALGLLGSGLLGGMAGSSAARIAQGPKNLLAEGIGRASKFNPEKYQKNAAVGLPVTLGMVSDNKMPYYAELWAGKTPGGIEKFDKLYKSRESAIAQNLGITTPDDLYSAVKNIPKEMAKKGAEGFHDKASDIYKKREAKFKPREELAIANKETVDVSDLIQEYEKKRERLQSNAAKSKFDKSKDGAILTDLKSHIQQDNPSLAVRKQLKREGHSPEFIDKFIQQEFPNAHKQGVGLEDINQLRKQALQESIALKSPLGGGTPESRDAAIRSQKLGNKRHEFIEQIGTPNEIHNAREARKFWSKYKNEENGMAKYVEKLTGSDNDASAFDKLTGKNPKYINIVRQGIPSAEHPKLLEAIIADMGDRQGKFNINAAYTGFSKLEKPVKDQLLKLISNKGARNNFAETMKFIGENKEIMEKLANTSNTAHTKHLIHLISSYGAAAAAALTGVSLFPLGIIASGHFLTAKGSKLATDQAFLRRMNDVIKASNDKGRANKLDLLFKTVNRSGRKMVHVSNKHKDRD